MPCLAHDESYANDAAASLIKLLALMAMSRKRVANDHAACWIGKKQKINARLAHKLTMLAVETICTNFLALN